MNNPFTAVPASVRKWLYLAYGVATLVVSSVAAYSGALAQPVPSWAVGLGGALVPVGVAFAAMAGSNVSPEPNTAVVEAPADVSIVPSYDARHGED